jgi:hypothetical protein
MMMRKTVPALFAVVMATSCSNFSSPERDRLADDFYDNAHTYYRGNDFLRSNDQIARGLEVAPDHYKLNQLHGKVLLQRARSDRRFYAQALEVFEKVRRLRYDHDYELTLDLAQAQHGLYLVHRRRWRQLRSDSLAPGLSAAERREKRAKADENHKLALAHMRAAAREYQSLIDAKDLGQFPAMERLFLLEIDEALGFEGATRAAQLRKAAALGADYLAKNGYRQKHYQVMIDITGDAAQEHEGQRRLKALRKRETDFRATYARVLFELQDWKEEAVQHDRILDLDPSNASAYFNRALCRAKLGRKSDAKRDLEHFLRLTKKPFESKEVRQAHALQESLGK